MRYRALAWLMVCGLVWGQEEKERRPPTPAEKAKELRAAALEMAAAATPIVAVTALVELAKLEPEKKKALEILEQALGVAAGAPPEQQKQAGSLAGAVVEAAAEVDEERAAEMMQGLPLAERGRPLGAIVRRMLEKKRLDRAVELLEGATGAGGYPYWAAQLILRQMPAEDPRRVGLFAAAAASFGPQGDVRGFAALLSKQWRSLPEAVVGDAVGRVVSAIVDRKEEKGLQTEVTLSTAAGAVSFEDEKDYELFDLVVVLKRADARRAKELLEKRPGLAAAVERFPEGVASMTKGSEGYSMNMRQKDGGGGQTGRMRAEAEASQQEQEAVGLARKDAQGAISKARQIGPAEARARALVGVARAVAGQDEGTARSVLGQAVTALAEIKDAGVTARQWPTVASVAALIKDKELGQQAIERGAAACAELYKADTNAEDPNTARRDQWPSVATLRQLMYSAAEVYGVEAEALLEKVTEVDLAVLGRIEMARGLEGKPRVALATSSGRAKKR